MMPSSITGFLSRALPGTRVARRIVLLCVACAILPIGLLALLSHATLKRQLREQAHERLVARSRAAGLAVQQRLLDAEAVLRARVDGARAGRVPSRADVIRIGSHAEGALLVGSLGGNRLSRLKGNLAVLYADESGGSLRIWLGVTGRDGDAVFAEVDPSWLWSGLGGEDESPLDVICVIASDGLPLVCPQDVVPWIAAAGPAVDSWQRDGKAYAAAARPISMQQAFGERWFVVASAPLETVFAPMSQYNRAYLFTIAGALLLVAIMSGFGVRQAMTPLVRLTAATSRLAARDFSQPVVIASNDEFEDLAASFNDMSGELRRQFEGMQVMVDLGQHLLAARDSEAIVHATLENATRILACRCAALLLLRMPGVSAQTQYWCYRDRQMTTGGAPNALRMMPDHAPDAPLLLTGREPGFAELPKELLSCKAAAIMMLPVRFSGRPTGALLFALDGVPRPQDALLARQLGDYAAVALSSAKLVRELQDLSFGALRTLARAIDAKSPWTAGHSDRVTALSLALGERIGLDAGQLEKLERGGLLHDVGKIGVPAAVLDKPGPLSEDEWAVMRSHTTLGGRILEPIGRYADVIPIVLYHHERWDGSGYPRGLAGEAIPLLARVLAVADVYDALTSERPYRAGMDIETALAIIENGSGTHFEERIATAFIAMIRDGTVDEILRKTDMSESDMIAAHAAA
jgi:putative nucleotidyltransferase with HDIG domain